MGDFNWDNVLMGIQLILGGQLLIVTILHFLERKSKNTLLAFLCLIVSWWLFWSILKIYTPPINKTILYLLYYINGFVFIPVLTYLFIHQIYKNATQSFKVKHLIAPIIISIAIPIIGLSGISSTLVRIVALPSLVIISVIYFFKVKKELKTLKPSIVPKAYLKYKIFVYSIIGVFFYMGVESCISYFFIKNYLFANYDGLNGFVNENTGIVFIDIMAKLVNGPWSWFNHIMGILYRVIFFFLFLFSMSELNYFKKIFLPKNIFYSNGINKDDLIKKIENYFSHSINYTRPDLDIELAASLIDCSKRELLEYFQHHKNTTFKLFINTLRTQHFKDLILNDSNDIYDMYSLAKMSGFKSKSTFYRIFKEIEGITPLEYKKLHAIDQEN